MDTLGQADCPGESGLPGALGQHLDQRNAAELTVLFFYFFDLAFLGKQRDRAEQAPREQSLISYTLSFNGVNPEVDLCSGRAEIYYIQFLRKGGFEGRESTGQPVGCWRGECAVVLLHAWLWAPGAA